MRFYCKTVEQKEEEWQRKYENWHCWFAWHPVRIDGNDCRWLEYVDRKLVRSEYVYESGCSEAQNITYWKREYRAILGRIK